jgi:hypothetical protein
MAARLVVRDLDALGALPACVDLGTDITLVRVVEAAHRESIDEYSRPFIDMPTNKILISA